MFFEMSFPREGHTCLLAQWLSDTLLKCRLRVQLPHKQPKTCSSHLEAYIKIRLGFPLGEFTSTKLWIWQATCLKSMKKILSAWKPRENNLGFPKKGGYKHWTINPKFQVRLLTPPPAMGEKLNGKNPPFTWKSI